MDLLQREGGEVATPTISEIRRLLYEVDEETQMFVLRLLRREAATAQKLKSVEENS